MITPNQTKKYSPEEYLELEEKAEYKNEYYKGEIIAMSSVNLQHNNITINFLAFIHPKLKGTMCKPYFSNMRVHVPANSFYAYPDICVTCGEQKFLDNEFDSDTLLNPVFICEVLSRSTADYDIGGKFMRYRSIESLKEYWVLSSLECRLQKFVKQLNNTWLLSETVDVNDTVAIECLSIDVPLKEVYLDVEF